MLGTPNTHHGASQTEGRVILGYAGLYRGMLGYNQFIRQPGSLPASCNPIPPTLTCSLSYEGVLGFRGLVGLGFRD